MQTNPRLAQQLGMRPQSLVAAVCRKGSYFGIIPTKLPNGRLMWPDDTLERLSKKGATK